MRSSGNRSSHQRCSVKKGVLRNFTKFTEKHLCQSPDNCFCRKLLNHFCLIRLQLFPKISLVQKGEIISDKSKVSNSFSNLFENAIRSFSIKANEHSQEDCELKNSVEIAIKIFEQHPSINLINKNITNNEKFHFSSVDDENF